MWVRVLMLLIFLGAIDFYAFQGFKLLVQGWPLIWRNVSYTLFWSGFVLLMIYWSIQLTNNPLNISKSWQSSARIILFILFISKFLMAMLSFTDDIRRLGSWGLQKASNKTAVMPGRSKFLAQTGLFLALLPLATLSYGIIRNRYRYQKLRETVRIKGLAPALVGLKIVQISDIHSGTFSDPEPVRAVIDLINEEQPDLIFFTGDLVNSRATEMNDFVEMFSQLKAKYGVFSVLGNHDYGDYDHWENETEKTANFDLMLAIQKKMGWQLLRNENKMIDVNGAALAIIGVENYSALPQFHKYGDLPLAYSGTETANCRILLSHDPTHWEAQVCPGQPDIALTLSGHTHGFQFGIEIPGFFRWSPSQYMYKQWGGLYQLGEQFLYVNRGLGMLGYPGRVGILPEITVLEFATA